MPHLSSGIRLIDCHDVALRATPPGCRLNVFHTFAWGQIIMLFVGLSLHTQRNHVAQREDWESQGPENSYTGEQRWEEGPNGRFLYSTKTHPEEEGY